LSVLSAICDAWITELQANVTGLDTTTVPSANVHRYAPWSVEAMAANAGERHLAIWPQGEAETIQHATVGQFPGDWITANFLITVWEEAGLESSRLKDDATANAAWLTLHEGIRARLFVQANTNLGVTGGYTEYHGVSFEMVGEIRVMVVRFSARYSLDRT
jgi:hypothetical protein